MMKVRADRRGPNSNTPAGLPDPGIWGEASLPLPSSLDPRGSSSLPVPVSLPPSGMLACSPLLDSPSHHCSRLSLDQGHSHSLHDFIPSPKGSLMEGLLLDFTNQMLSETRGFLN